MEILSGGMGFESKIKTAKPAKDSKPGKAGGKDGKSPAGGANAGGANAGGANAGGAADGDKGHAVAPEVLPVEASPEVGDVL